MRASTHVSAALVATMSLFVGTRALADGALPAEPSAERLQSAAEEYDKGRRAFTANDFEGAAVHFENAYHDAPRAEALRAAIRARHSAHDDARAATLSSLAAIRYGSDAQTMQLVNETLADLSPKLLAVNLACNPECSVAADGKVVSVVDARQVGFYLPPGKHDLVVTFSGDRTRLISVDGRGGDMRDLALDAPLALSTHAPPPVIAPAHDSPPPAARVAPSSKPLGPLVFWIGAGLTAAGVAATIVSGLDAQNSPGKDAVLRDCVGQGQSCPTFQSGKSAELRTNVILAATGGVALATAVVGVFFTQWSKAPVARGVTPYVGAGEFGLHGRF